jgi:hypothetical protein
VPTVTTLNGLGGFGYAAVVVEGSVPRYGLDLPHRSRQGNGVTWADGSPDTEPGLSQAAWINSPAGGVGPLAR